MNEVKKKDDYQKALNLYSQAIKEFRKGDYEKASASFENLIEKFPDEYELTDRAKVYLAVCQRGTKKESLSPKTLDDYLFYGQMKINKGDYEGALKLLEKALEFKKEEAKIYYLIATAYILSGRQEESLEALKKAIQKDKSLAILAQNEPDFQALWDDKRFKVLVKLT
ncbi:MAG: tetratricopeptide repeat protein [Candidatus Aminicenantes bacterium]|nr:tetratricopeptide repeat protein [Candidatus Aminicenantes bacterium]